VEEIGIPGEDHRPSTSHWQTLSHNGVTRFELTPLKVVGTSCKSKLPHNYDHDDSYYVSNKND
jgi:hypothetical protein